MNWQTDEEKERRARESAHYREQARVRRLQESIQKIEKSRQRALAHGRVRRLLDQSHEVFDVGVKGKNWTFWNRDRKSRGLSAPRHEIVLSEDEKKAFAEWLQVRERELIAEADALELKIAKGGVDD